MTALEGAIAELMAFPLFHDLSRGSILELCRGGEIHTSRHREVLFRFSQEAGWFGIVLSGAYKLSRPSPGGEDTIVHFSTPGDVIAAFIMAQPRPLFPVSAIAMGPSRLLKIPRQAYITSWKQNPDLIFRIQNLLSSRMSLMQDQRVLVRAPLSLKVANLLINLLDKNPRDEGLELPLPLTRKEIADNLGASVEAVIRVMSEWSKQGWIETNDQHIRVLRPDVLLNQLKEA